jgi:inner membrane protein YidH
MSEATDATRRTRLANERTYLAWWRTGLASLAVGLGVGKVVPELSDGTKWPFSLVGAGFAVLGIVFVVYAFRRQRVVEAALREGRYAPLDDRAAVGLTAVGVVLGIAMLILVLFL